MSKRTGGATEQQVRVFLSWSGETSRLIANALADGMRALSDRLEPWLSEDLEPGVEWANTLIPQIRKARVAVLCLTHRNVGASWIAFETGAYFSSPLRKGVIPYLFDFPQGDLAFPLGLFQSLTADWKGTKALFVRLGELAGLDADAVEERFATTIWPQLNDQLGVIRNLRQEAEASAAGSVNIANAFFLGHDLRWTLAVLEAEGTPEDIKHGLIQVLHQAEDLGLGDNDTFLILKQRTGEVLALGAEEWTDEIRDRIERVVNLAFERFGGYVISCQPGYRSYSPENRESWLAIQSEGRA